MNFCKHLITFVCLLILALSLPAQPTGFIDQEYVGPFDQAVGLTFDDNGRMYVYEKGGKVWIVENDQVQPTPLLDISDEVGNWRDFGMLGFVLDPNFLSNGYFYCLYIVDRHHLLNFGTPNYNPNTNEYFDATVGRITRFQADVNTNFTTLVPNSRNVLLGETVTNDGFPNLHQSHGTGSLVFGTDGTLLASFGDGASYSSVDQGSANETYWQQAINDGIITSAQNIGAYRAQLLNNLSGKLIRIDPATGNGIPSNPFYQSGNPGSAQSKIFARGLRNPCRMTLKPETGSHDPADGDPGVIYIGDVGWGNREELNVVTGAGLNFGWPKFEGMTYQPGYNNSNYEPATHERAKVDWRGGTARGFVNGTIYNVGSSTFSGPNFNGNCSIGGVWYEGNDFPAEWANTYFHADYGGDWIKNFSFDANENPTQVRNFKSGADGIVFIGTSPFDGGIYYIAGASGGNPQVNNAVRKISFTGGNLPPFALASADVLFGTSPLTVSFKGDLSYDPNGDAITYDWNFGDGSSSSEANPSHTFSTGGNQPTSFNVTLTISDGELSEQKSLTISLNNTPPQILSTSIDNLNTFSHTSTTTLNLNASVTDAEHNNSQLSYEWFTELHHNNHFHSEAADNNAVTSTQLSPVGCDGATYFYRIKLQVTDPAGLSSTYIKDIYPDCSGANQTLTFATVGNQLTISPPIQLNGAASSGLPVIFHVISGPATISGNTLTLSGTPGVVTLRAIQSGNATYAPAIPLEQTFTVDPAGGTGLTGNYFNNINFTSQALNRIDPTINFDWGTGSPDPAIGENTFSVRWEGGLLPLYNETYTFTVTGDDGVRLWVDNQLIVDAWVDQSPTDHSGTINLTGGQQVPIRLEYYENGGGAVAKLRWSSNSQANQIIPQNFLFPEFETPDTDPPTVSLSTTSNEVDAAFIVSVQFNEAVIGLSEGDLNISNGTASSLSGSGQTFSLTITPSANGTVTIQLPANQTQDAAGNGNTPSNLLSVNYTDPNIDITPPVVTLSTASNNVEAAFTVNVQFDETVSGLSQNDFTISNGSASDLSGSGQNYTLTVSPTNDGTVTVQLPANQAQDAAGNGNTISNLLSIIYTEPNVDTSPPTATLSTAATEVDAPFEVVVSFNEAITGLTENDFSLTNGTTAGDLSNIGLTYYFTVEPITNGLVTIQLPAGSVQDLAGNNNNPSNLLNVTYTEPTTGDCTNPTNIALNKPTSQSSEYSNGAESSLAVDGNTNGNWYDEYSVSSTSWGNQPWWEVDLGSVSEIQNINVWNRTDCCSEFLGNYYILISDAPMSGNLNQLLNQSGVTSYQQTTIAGSPTNIQINTNGRYVRIQNAGSGFVALAEVEVFGCENGGGPGGDQIPPTVTLSTSSNNVSGPFTVDVDFNENVSGLTLGDFSVNNGSLSGLSGSGNAYSLNIDPVADGTVSITLPGSSVQDGAGNDNLVSNTLNVTYTEPVIGDCSNPSNVALNKPTNHSVDYNGSGAGSELAVDGNTSGNWYADYSVSSTSWSSQPYWEVDLEVIYALEYINVWNRSDCCMDFLSNYYVLVSDVPFASDNLNTVLNQTGVTAYQQTIAAGTPTQVTIGRSGRYVRIQNAGSGFVALAEVEVFGCIDNNNGDITPPSVTLAASVSTTDGNFGITAEFNENIVGLANSDFTVTNGTATATNGSGASYALMVIPDQAGNVTVTLPAGTVTDASGNANLVSNTITVNYNPPPIPTVTITSPTEGSIISGTDVQVGFSVAGDLATYDATHLLITLDDNPPVDFHDVSTGGSYTFTDVPVGAHTITAQLADALHFPIDFPESSDEVNFTTIDNNPGGNCTTLENLALNGTASQSSLYSGSGAGPELAIDGNTSGIWFGDYSVSSTSWGIQPYWQIDLGASYNIEEINIWNRTDCCSDFLSNYYILISDDPITADDLTGALAQPGVSNYHQTTTAGTPSTISTPQTGRYIRIQNNGAGFITLAEVQVMGCPISSGGSSFVVQSDDGRNLEATLYPNPANENIVIKYDTKKAGTLRYIIANGQGVIYKEEEFAAEVGEDKIIVNVSQWPAAHYTVYIQMEGYRFKTIPFIRIRD